MNGLYHHLAPYLAGAAIGLLAAVNLAPSLPAPVDTAVHRQQAAALIQRIEENRRAARALKTAEEALARREAELGRELKELEERQARAARRTAGLYRQLEEAEGEGAQ